MAEQILENIYWIGSDNPEGRDFHGISSPRGGSYNSYLITDEKTAIIDGANMPFLDAYKASISQVANPSAIDYIIINHAEPDHTGGIVEILKDSPRAKLVCTEKCKDFMLAQYDIEAEFITVGNEDTLSLGKYTLSFHPDPFVHWPETMMTFVQEPKVLFSADLFGTEVGHEALFADQMKPFADLSRTYFTLIMRPFAAAVKKAVTTARKLGPEYIAPSHGPVYRKNVAGIMDYYDKMIASPEEGKKVLVVYYSIWHASEQTAKMIESELKARGFEPVLCNLATANMVEIMSQSLTSKAVIMGSLTFAGSYHPLYETLFALLKLNGQKNKPAGVFCSYGWAPVAAKKLKEKATETGFDVKVELASRFRAATTEQVSSFVEELMVGL